ncbi:MAG: hypothetical protein ABIV63_11200 [Caldimonas sp.]
MHTLDVVADAPKHNIFFSVIPDISPGAVSQWCVIAITVFGTIPNVADVRMKGQSNPADEGWEPSLQMSSIRTPRA